MSSADVDLPSSRALYLDFLALPNTRHKDHLPIRRLNHTTSVGADIANDACEAVLECGSRCSLCAGPIDFYFTT